jgi:murein DD-endopeptidase MepM/ murein hydrolase activator NlpD
VLEPQKNLMIQLSVFLGVAMALTHSPPSFSSSAAWERPLVGSSLLRSYLQSESPYSAGHRGVDYQVKLGQEVFAPADGRVHFVGQVVNRSLISLSHDGDLLSAFEPVCSDLALGEQVLVGDLIGEVCEGDSTYQPHCPAHCLHFSARKNGEYLSPLWLLGELGPSRLLPWIEN